LIALAIAITFIFVGSFAILKITDLISPMAVSKEVKKVGSDLAQHGENIPAPSGLEMNPA
jgi:Amt family ammonium transporter